MFGGIPINLILVGLLAASPFVTYGWMTVKQKVVVARAVKAERVAGIATCNVRVGAIETKLRTAVETGVREAREAADHVTETPEDVAKLKGLCKASASCRNRGAL